MSNLHVIAQSEVLQGYELSAHISKEDFTIFDARSGRVTLEHDLQALDREMKGRRIIVFCSLDAARIIRAKCPELGRGLILNQRFLHWHVYAPMVPSKTLLNHRFFMLPFGLIAEHQTFIETSFGSRIFFRPDSPMKDFPGTVTEISDLPQEVSAIQQIFNPDPAEMAIICPAQDLPDFEFRFWLIDGMAYSPAGYSFHREHLQAPACPVEIIDLADQLARHLEVYENALVADFVMAQGEARLVELNGFSTSGFYPSMDFAKVYEAVDRLMI